VQKNTLAAVLAALCLGTSALSVSACGSTSPTSAPTPPVVATPPISFTLDAPADYFQYSDSLGHLAAGDSLDVTFSPVVINRAATEAFAHSIAFWLMSAPPPDSPPANAVSFSFGWYLDSGWVLGYRTPQVGFTWTSTAETIVIGTQRTVRVSRRTDGAAQFWLDGGNLLTVPDSETSQDLYAQVVGVRSDFSYAPHVVTGAARSAISTHRESPAVRNPCASTPSACGVK